MDKFFDKIEERASNYFQMSDEDKDDLLADFANTYIKGKFRVGMTFQHILGELSKDIEQVSNDNRFELAALMTEVRNSLLEVVDELDAQHKQQLNKGK